MAEHPSAEGASSAGIRLAAIHSWTRDDHEAERLVDSIYASEGGGLPLVDLYERPLVPAQSDE